MPRKRSGAQVYVEAGSKRVFAGALEWPGWCRGARNEAAALDALVSYAPRYASVVAGTEPVFSPPAGPSDLTVVERLDGDATTDFGAPSIAPAADGRAVDAPEQRRFLGLLEASWTAFDRATQAATGLELRKGPRGGGRDLQAIGGHVVAAEAGYVRRLAATPPKLDEADAWTAASEVRSVVREALARAVAEGLPERGPRGGRIWTLRYFVRRAVWHVLDHAWEIEDRSPA